MKKNVSKERWNQMMTSHDNDEEWVREIIDDWGVDVCERGYDIFDFDGTGMLEICMVNDVGAFESDEEAVGAAVRDGIKIIPEDELPENFERRYYGWIDTEENRKVIMKYCDIED